MTRFFWKEKQYEDISVLGNELLEELWKSNTSMHPFVDELLQKGVLSQYIICLDENDTQKANAVKAIESSYRAFINDDRQRTMNYYLLAYMLSGRKVLYKEGVEFKNVEELAEFLKNAMERSYDEFEKICRDLIDNNDNLDIQFESWLCALGKKYEIARWRKSLQG